MGRNPCYRPKIQHVPAQLCRLVPTGGSTTSASPPPAHVLGLRIGHRAGKQGPRASLIFRPHSRMSPPNGPRLTVLSSPTKFVRICFYGTLHPLSNLLSSRPLSLSLSCVYPWPSLPSNSSPEDTFGERSEGDKSVCHKAANVR